jgi:hypothetical protein
VLLSEQNREVSVVTRRIAKLLVEIVIGPVFIVGAMFFISLVYYAPAAVLNIGAQQAAQNQSTTDQQQCNQRVDAQKKAEVDTLQTAFLEEKKHLTPLALPTATARSPSEKFRRLS